DQGTGEPVQGLQRPMPGWRAAARPRHEPAEFAAAGQPDSDQQRPGRRGPEEASEPRAELGQAPREGAGQGDDGNDQGPAAAVPRSDRGILQDPGEEPGAVEIDGRRLAATRVFEGSAGAPRAPLEDSGRG